MVVGQPPDRVPSPEPRTLRGTDGFLTQTTRHIRNLLLPREAPRVPGYDLAGGTSGPETGDGSTLWDAFPLAGGRTAFLVLRASDGVLPPSFLLGLGRAAFRGLAPDHEDPAALVAAANKILTVGTPEAADQVLDCAIVVPGEDGVSWTSAGNPPGGVIGREGTFEELGSQGPPLGMMAGFSYRSQHHPLGVGDACIALSHGASGLFKGAADLVASMVGKPVGDVVTTLHKAIRRAQGGDSEVSVLFMRKG